MIHDLTEAIVQKEDLQRRQYLTFMLHGDEFGIEIGCITEIIEMQPTNTLPEVPEYIIGVISHRGKITPVMDLRLKIKKVEITFTDRTCIVVVKTKRFSAGLIVDQVVDVVEINESDIVSQQDALSLENHPYIWGVSKNGDKETTMIDCEILFEVNEPEILKETEKGERT